MAAKNPKIATEAHLIDDIPAIGFQIIKIKNNFSFSFVSKAILTELQVTPKAVKTDFNIFLELLDKNYSDSFINSLNKCVSNLCNWSWEGEFNLPNHKKKWLQGLGKPKKINQNTFVINGVFSDISFYKNQEQEHKEINALAKSGFWEVNLANSTVYWSEEVYKIHEVKPNLTITLAEAINFYTSKSKPIITLAVEKALKEGKPWDFELQITTAKGNTIWVRAIGKAKFENGVATKLYGVFRNINERKIAEEQFRLIFEFATDPQLLLSNGLILDCNQAAVTLLKCKNKAQLISKQPSIFSPKYQPDGQLSSEKSKEIDTMVKENKFHKFEWVHQNLKGELLSVIVTLNQVSINNKKVFLAVWHDVTEQKKAQELIMRSQAMLEETQELTHSGSWEADLITGKNYWSDEAFRIFGLSPKNGGPESFSFGKMIHPDDKEAYKTAINNALEHLIVCNIDLRIILPNGQIKQINAIGKPFVNEKGKVTKLYGAIVDITHRKNAEIELIKAKELAEQATIAKSQFLSTMSHEIRTPMNAVMGFTNLLLQKNTDIEQLEFLKILKFSGDSLLLLINDILDFSKIDEGMIEFELIEFSLAELVNNIKLTLLPLATEKKIDLKITIAKNLNYALIGDPLRLSQILTNLINNAIKFTQKGEVGVAITLAKTTKTNSTINFEISDTGIGIEKDKIDYIFERFTQASSDTTRKYGGTGLGLAITKKLIALQNGNITVKSELGKGSTFCFTLTYKNGIKNCIIQLKESLNNEEKNLKDIKILVAEDNEINIMLVKHFMKIWGIECDFTKNGLETLAQVQLKNYQMVFMDLQMPEMDGYEATKKIRQLPSQKYKNLPIVALTASAMLDVREKVFLSGMNDYISKPFTQNELKLKIEKYSILKIDALNL